MTAWVTACGNFKTSSYSLYHYKNGACYFVFSKLFSWFLHLCYFVATSTGSKLQLFQCWRGWEKTTNIVPIDTPVCEAMKNEKNSLLLTNFHAKKCISYDTDDFAVNIKSGASPEQRQLLHVMKLRGINK
jgi:hypothetical protein